MDTKNGPASRIISSVKPGENKNPVAFVLVGLPGSGKSTWARNHPRRLAIASSDHYIRQIAVSEGLAYKEAFEQHNKKSFFLMKERVKSLVRDGKSFIWDQVNLTRKKRASIYGLLHRTHRVVFVVFLTPPEICWQRNLERNEREGQGIDRQRFEMLVKLLTVPDETEPHDRIIRVGHATWHDKT